MKFREGFSAGKLAGIVILLAISTPLAVSRADNFTTSVEENSTQTWNDPIWEPGPVSPAAGNSYEVLSGGVIWNNSSNVVQTFSGDSLTLDAGATLGVTGMYWLAILQFPGVGGNPGLILNGGEIQTGGAYSGQKFTIEGNVSVASASTIDYNWKPSLFVIAAQLTGNGSLIFIRGSGSNQCEVLGTNNSYTGRWMIEAGSLIGVGDGSLGSGNVFVFEGASLEVDYDIQSPGTLRLLGNNSVMVLHQDCQFGAVTINGVSLAPGTYTYNNLLAQFPRNFAPGGSGSITVAPPPSVSVSPPPPPPTLQGIYVDYVGGSDDNIGTNPATAWQHCPGDAAATGVANGASLTPGTTVWFKGGVPYVFTAPAQSCYTPGIQVYWSGTANAPITYASTNAWGNGSRAIFTDNYAQNSYAAFWNYYGASNIVFNNLEIGPMGGSNSLPVNTGSNVGGVPPNPAWGIFFFTTIASNVTVENCYFHNLGYWQDQEPISANSIQGGCGVSSAGIQVAGDGAGVNGLTVTNCEFTAVCNAIDVEYGIASYNLTVAGCNFHDYTVWSIDLAATGSGALGLNNVFISGNQFHDFDWAYAPFYWAGYSDPPHHDGIYLRPGSAAPGSNINIYANMFWGTHPNASGTAAIWAASSSANIYNNLFINCNSLANGDYAGTLPIDCSAGANSGSSIPSLMRVLNNTIIVNTAANLDDGQSTEALYMGCDGSETWPLNDTLIVENNIFYDFRTTIYGYDLVGTDPIATGTSAWTFNYNDYSTVLPALFQITGLNSGLNLGGLQALGWETNGRTGNPLFVNLAYGSGTNSWQNNYALSSGSPCIGAGANLGSLNLPGLNADIAGNPRPTSGPWDIGAYQQ